MSQQDNTEFLANIDTNATDGELDDEVLEDMAGGTGGRPGQPKNTVITSVNGQAPRPVNGQAPSPRPGGQGGGQGGRPGQ